MQGSARSSRSNCIRSVSKLWTFTGITGLGFNLNMYCRITSRCRVGSASFGFRILNCKWICDNWTCERVFVMDSWVRKHFLRGLGDYGPALALASFFFVNMWQFSERRSKFKSWAQQLENFPHGTRMPRGLKCSQTSHRVINPSSKTSQRKISSERVNQIRTASTCVCGS